MKTVCLSLLVLLFARFAAAAPVPTYDDLRYSEAYGRSTMDLWLPQSDEPTPIIILFHGGSFVGGNKEQQMPYKSQMLALLKEGIAVASIGYPLIGDNGAMGVIGNLDLYKIFTETVRAVRFLQAHAADYNLDPERFVVGGVSAGALISEYLTYAEPLGISVCLGLEQPYAVELVMGMIQPGAAPLILCTYSGVDDRVHNPDYAKRLKAHCDKVGATCYLYGGNNNGLPAIPGNQAFVPHAMKIIRAVWARELE